MGGFFVSRRESGRAQTYTQDVEEDGAGEGVGGTMSKREGQACRGRDDKTKRRFKKGR